MVLVPILGGKGIDFAFLMTELAIKYRIYSIDLLGFGESDKPIDVDYSTDFQGHQLFRFFESQKITNVYLMGHSLGGWLSLRSASEWPQKVRNLILIVSGGLKYMPLINVKHFADPKNLDDLRASFKIMCIPLPPEFVKKDILYYYQKQSPVMKRAMDSVFDGHKFLDGKLTKAKMPVLLYGAERIKTFRWQLVGNASRNATFSINDF